MITKKAGRRKKMAKHSNFKPQTQIFNKKCMTAEVKNLLRAVLLCV